MRKIPVILILSFLFSALKGQMLVYDKFWVQFSNKNNTPYSLSNPLQYLTQRSLDRRARYNIQIDSTDLPVDENYVQQVLSTGVTLFTRSKWLNAITIVSTDTTLVDEIKAMPFVLSVTPVHQTVVNSIDKLTKQQAIVTQTNDSEYYGGAYGQVLQVNGNYLHNMGYWGDGMQVAVLDAGFINANIVSEFDSLRINNRILGTWDFVHQTENVYTTDDHGREVLSVLAANQPGTYVGAAPRASYYLFITEDVTTEYKVEEGNWVAAAEMADSLGVDVISTSLGYTTFDDSTENYTYEDMNGHTARCTMGANAAANKGILVVASAGNEGNDPWRYVAAPGDGDSVLTIGAVDAQGQVAYFSSRGPDYGGLIKPDVCGNGFGAAIIDANGNVIQGSGTSFSCPLIAGFATCLWEAALNKTNMDIDHIIEQTASYANDPNDSFGYGIANFEAALDSLLSQPGQALYNVSKYPLAYPNPFNNNLTVMLFDTLGGVKQLEVVDSKGAVVLNETVSLLANVFYSVDLSALNPYSAGVYTILVFDSNESEVTRAVKF